MVLRTGRTPGGSIHAGEEAGQFSADGVLDVLHKAQEAGYAPASRMLDFFAQEQSQGGAPQLAVLELERHEPPPEAAQPDQPGGAGRTADKLRVAGSGLFRAGRMEAVLTPAQTRGLQWLGLDGRMEATPLSVELPPGGLAAANAYLQRATVRAGEAGGLPEFSIRLQVRAAVLELPEDLGPGWEEQVAALQERAVRREVEEALAATAGQGWDPCELYQLARQQAPGCYWGHQEDWGEQLARARFRVEVDCQVIDHLFRHEFGHIYYGNPGALGENIQSGQGPALEAQVEGDHRAPPQQAAADFGELRRRHGGGEHHLGMLGAIGGGVVHPVGLHRHRIPKDSGQLLQVFGDCPAIFHDRSPS